MLRRSDVDKISVDNKCLLMLYIYIQGVFHAMLTKKTFIPQIFIIFDILLLEQLFLYL